MASLVTDLIIKRLRIATVKASDEIKRLRRALKQIADMDKSVAIANPHDALKIARAALEDHDD